LYGPYFTWIFFGWYDSHWWAENDTNINCTAEEMTIFVNNSLTIQQYPINEMTDKVVIGNYSYNSFFTEYESRISSSPYQSTYVAHIAYDAVWTFALALDKVISRLSTGNVGNCNKSVVNSLEDFDYKNDGDISCLLKNELSKTYFEGLTGKVEFDMDGTRLSTSSPIRIYQIHNNNTRQIARSTNNIVTFINGFDFTNVFPSGVPPDGTPDKIISHFHTALIVLLYVLSSAGLVLCLICLIFTLIFRNKR
jgi:gamma-aminobutyric acid type B receptor